MCAVRIGKDVGSLDEHGTINDAVVEKGRENAKRSEGTMPGKTKISR